MTVYIHIFLYIFLFCNQLPLSLLESFLTSFFSVFVFQTEGSFSSCINFSRSVRKFLFLCCNFCRHHDLLKTFLGFVVQTRVFHQCCRRDFLKLALAERRLDIETFSRVGDYILPEEQLKLNIGSGKEQT